jgi:ATP-dependent DNA helicase RecG
MAAFARETNGFALAEADLALRGPGEFFGTRQAGLPEFRLPLPELFGDARLVEAAREAAREVLAEDAPLTRLDHAPLARALAGRFASWEAGGPACG